MNKHWTLMLHGNIDLWQEIPIIDVDEEIGIFGVYPRFHAISSSVEYEISAWNPHHWMSSTNVNAAGKPADKIICLVIPPELYQQCLTDLWSEWRKNTQRRRIYWNLSIKTTLRYMKRCSSRQVFVIQVACKRLNWPSEVLPYMLKKSALGDHFPRS